MTALLIFVVGFGIFYIGEKNKEKAKQIEESLSLKVNTTEKKIEKGVEVTFLIEVKNNNLKKYKKSYDPSCENVWTLELMKDGEVIEGSPQKCLEKEKKELELESSESLRFILNKKIEKAGNYTATIKTFGQEYKKEFTIKQEQIK